MKQVDLAIVTPGELAEITGGTWTSEPLRPIRFLRCSVEHTEDGLKDFLHVPELFTGSDNIDADYALMSCLEAGERGASAYMASERPRNLSADAPCLIVDKPARAISRLAEVRRAETPARFVAVTGSAGKSTTKEMITAMLSSSGPAVKSVFNFNAGRSSVELTLSNLGPFHEFCVAEFSGVGDIEIQSEIFRPDVAVITNVLWEHVDRFEKTGLRGDEVIDGIVERKTSLIRNLNEGGTAVLNRDNEYFDRQSAVLETRPDVRLVTFGQHEKADIRLIDADMGEDSTRVVAAVNGREVSYTISIAGFQMVLNSLAALAVADTLGIDMEPALEELATLKAGFRRGEVHTVPWGGGTITAINETVSSSVPSVGALLKSLSARPIAPGGRRVAVLGWIGELGSTSISDMERLAREAEASPIDYFYTNGEDMRNFNRSFRDRTRIAPHAGSMDQLRRMLEAGLRPNDTVVIKGNRKPLEFSLRRLWESMIDPRLETTANPARTAEPEDEIRVVLGGDTYFGEDYQARRARKAQINYLEAFGYG
ncbi:MAG TPA: UDP-N-acetylmuramoyl-tripeptide--D-alanyl-D-alanine ligase, partial [Afifellaceae bacterium]|nr:UDP-N-acetylmuramoyl-tripeptide--D-alanyl-D-alanine ligase [Afifellaceae bacterium]